jgi:acyl-CoA thioesterase II
VFTGRNQKLEYHRVFGGQLLAQFTAIASLTYPDKTAKPQHAVFAQEGRPTSRFAARRRAHHDGRSFASLITARQSRGVIATSSISMHVAEAGPAHKAAATSSPKTAPWLARTPRRLSSAPRTEVDDAGKPVAIQSD